MSKETELKNYGQTYKDIFITERFKKKIDNLDKVVIDEIIDIMIKKRKDVKS